MQILPVINALELLSHYNIFTDVIYCNILDLKTNLLSKLEQCLCNNKHVLQFSKIPVKFRLVQK